MERETYYIARLVVNDETRFTEVFETLEEARLWGMREAKLNVSDSERISSLISLIPLLDHPT